MFKTWCVCASRTDDGTPFLAVFDFCFLLEVPEPILLSILLEEAGLEREPSLTPMFPSETLAALEVREDPWGATLVDAERLTMVLLLDFESSYLFDSRVSSERRAPHEGYIETTW